MSGEFNAIDAYKSYSKKIEVVTKMTRGVALSNLRCLVISGSPGIGKSYNVLEELSKLKKSHGLNVIVSKGHLTPYKLYGMLVANAGPESILVFDDCDAVLDNTQALNLLKAATEFAKKRYVSWNSSMNADTGVDDQVEFKGKVIVLTNKRLNDNPHYQAFIDRVHYYDMRVTFEEKLAKIVSMARKVGEQIDPDLNYDDVILWLIKNKDQINQDRFSLRNFIKLAEMKSMFGDDWVDMIKIMQDVVEFN
jgi:hypothetical protein